MRGRPLRVHDGTITVRLCARARDDRRHVLRHARRRVGAGRRRPTPSSPPARGRRRWRWRSRPTAGIAAARAPRRAVGGVPGARPRPGHRPARRVVLTTSGTAAVELHAAVVEAHQAEVPLLVCTADRPPELHDVGAPQTIDQTHLYGPSVRLVRSTRACPTSRGVAVVALARRAGRTAAPPDRPPGPVHLNLPFREPLVGDARAAARRAAPTAARGTGAVVRTDALPIDEPRRPGRPPGAPRGDRRRRRHRRRRRRAAAVASRSAGRCSPTPAAAPACRPPTRCATSTRSCAVAALADRLRPDVVLRLGLAAGVEGAGPVAGRRSAPGRSASSADGARLDPDRARRPSWRRRRRPAAVAAADAGRRRRLDGDRSRRRPTARGLARWRAARRRRGGRGHRRRCWPATPSRPSPASPATSCAALPDGADARGVVVDADPRRRVVRRAARRRAGARQPRRQRHRRRRVDRGRRRPRPTGAARPRCSSATSPSCTTRNGLLGAAAPRHRPDDRRGRQRRRRHLLVPARRPAALDRSAFEQLFGTPHGVDLAALAAAHGIELPRSSSASSTWRPAVVGRGQGRRRARARGPHRPRRPTSPSTTSSTPPSPRRSCPGAARRPDRPTARRLPAVGDRIRGGRWR